METSTCSGVECILKYKDAYNLRLTESGEVRSETCKSDTILVPHYHCESPGSSQVHAPLNILTTVQIAHINSTIHKFGIRHFFQSLSTAIMASDIGDFKLASTAAGFTLGFSVLCVWNAIKQTRNVRSPLRSAYIYMVWGEIVANLVIGILAWLFLDGTLKPG